MSLKTRKHRPYIVKRNRWIRRRFDQFRRNGDSVDMASIKVAKELHEEVTPATVKRIVYSGDTP